MIDSPALNTRANKKRRSSVGMMKPPSMSGTEPNERPARYTASMESPARNTRSRRRSAIFLPSTRNASIFNDDDDDSKNVGDVSTGAAAKSNPCPVALEDAVEKTSATNKPKEKIGRRRSTGTLVQSRGERTRGAVRTMMALPEHEEHHDVEPARNPTVEGNGRDVTPSRGTCRSDVKDGARGGSGLQKRCSISGNSPDGVYNDEASKRQKKKRRFSFVVPKQSVQGNSDNEAERCKPVEAPLISRKSEKNAKGRNSFDGKKYNKDYHTLTYANINQADCSNHQHADKENTTPVSVRGKGIRSILNSTGKHQKTPTPRKYIKTIDFVSPEAAEYNITSPSVSMTPIPKNSARKMYPIPGRGDYQDEEEDNFASLRGFGDTILEV